MRRIFHRVDTSLEEAAGTDRAVLSGHVDTLRSEVHGLTRVDESSWHAGDPAAAPAGPKPYLPDAPEQAMAARTGFVEDAELAGRVGVETLPTRAGPRRPNPRKRALLLRDDQGELGVYKPGSREPQDMHQGIPNGAGEQAKREVAAYRVDALLGFGRVPPTAMIDGPLGSGSLQHYVPSVDGPVDISGYPRSQREQVAVLDYITAGSDDVPGNYRTAADGSLVAVDHGLTFPEHPDSNVGIVSPFTKEFHNVELSDAVMERIDALHPDDLRSALADTGLSDPAIEGAVARLAEIRENRMITGAAWPSDIRASLRDSAV